MLEFLKNPTFFKVLSIAGASSAILGSILSGVAYRGRLGERYSPLNHFISELGEWGISRLAWVFNLGLILCGLCILPASISLGLLIPGIWSKLGMAAGIIMAIGVSGVGVFPMNKLTPHTWVAMTYFRAGLAIIILFTIAIGFQPENPPVLPRLLSLAGLPAILAFAGFIIYMRINFKLPQNPLAPLETERPRVWGMPLAEWSCFLTTVPWFLAIALGL